MRGLVLSGAFIVVLDGTVTTYGPGALFMVEAGLNHAEQVGSDGVKIVVARKY